jgi:hypothetical protein
MGAAVPDLRTTKECNKANRVTANDDGGTGDVRGDRSVPPRRVSPPAPSVTCSGKRPSFSVRRMWTRECMGFSQPLMRSIPLSVPGAIA